MKEKRTYLGDGLYAWSDGYHVVLAASNGIEDHDTVYLDSEVQDAFIRFLERTHGIEITIEKQKKEREGDHVC